METLAARGTTEWLDFTPQHARVRSQAREVALGEGRNHVAAVVGVYGSGKSTLLFDLLRACREGEVLALWEEAAAFFDRLLGARDAVRADEFVRLTLEWVEDLRSGDALRQVREGLVARGRGDVAEAMLDRPGGCERVVLLLDEMEQAHEWLRGRVVTDDGNPLRSLFDACGPGLGLVVAYAPESYHALGDADRGRHVTLRVPPLHAGVIAEHFDVSRGFANFAWWASRGRARGVVQAVGRVAEPASSGELADHPQLLADLLDDLPRVFGVPAVVQDHLNQRELMELPHLAPSACDQFFGIAVDTTNALDWVGTIEEQVVTQLGDDVRRQVVAVLLETSAVLAGCADDSGVAYLGMDETEALVDLAAARAQEAGSITDLPTKVRDAMKYAFHGLSPGLQGQRLTHPLQRLADDIFPSPFTDPLLPIDGHHPTLAELASLFVSATAGRTLLLTWAEHDLLVFGGFEDLETWLSGRDPAALARQELKALILRAGTPGPVTRLATESGHVRSEQLSSFAASFIQSAVVVLGREGDPEDRGAPDLDQLREAVGESRDLRRKVNWHLDRLELLVKSLRPQASREFERAWDESEQLRSFVATRRLSQDSPGLLALVQTHETPSALGASALTELAEVFGGDRPLRRLTARSKKLSGAAVVIDDLLPGRSGTRWVQRGHPLLRAFTRRHAEPACRPLLAALLAPDHPSAMEIVLGKSLPEALAPDLKAGAQSLSRMSSIVGRLDKVHSGIARLLEDAPARLAQTMDLGTTLNTAVKARSDTEALERLVAGLPEVPEEWVRSLTLWTIGQFLEVALSVIGGEEASLRAWEKAADQGKDAGDRAELLVRSLRDKDWNGFAGRVDAARTHQRVHLEEPEAFSRAVADFATRLTGYERLAASLDELTSGATEAGVSCDKLIRRFDPKEDDPEQDAELVREVVSLLEDVDGRLPKPKGELRTWLITLRAHLAKSREERLRSRLEEVVGPTIALRLHKVYEPHVDEIEDTWGTLADCYQQGVMDRLIADQASTSEEVAAAVDSAKRRQQAMKAFESGGFTEDMDAALVDACHRGEIDVAAIGRALEARAVATTWVEHLAGELAPRGVLEEVVRASGSFEEVEVRMDKFEEVVEPLWEELHQLSPDLSPGDLDEQLDPDRYVEELSALRTLRGTERRQLLEKIDAIRAILNEFAGSTGEHRAPRTLDGARAAVKEAEEQARQVLEAAHAKLQERCKARGVVVPSPDDGELNDLAKAVRDDRATVESMANLWTSLEELGVDLDEAGEGIALAEAVGAFRSRLEDAERRQRDLRIRVDELKLRMRLFKVPEDDVSAAAESGRLPDLGDAISLAEQALESIITDTMPSLSDQAKQLWDDLRRGEADAAVAELVRAGLLVAVSPGDLDEQG